VEHVKAALRTLTMKVCHELEGQEIPKRPIWTVVYTPDVPPHVAMDFDRPAMSSLRYSLTVGLHSFPEYKAAAVVFEEDPAFAAGIVINNGGGLLLPEETNFTRAFVTNFLWRYLREGQQLGWNESRFDETFEELKIEVARRSIVVHTTLPLSNLKMDIDALDFGDELRLEPASISELERWLNPDRPMPSFGGGPPQWDTRYLDRPAVLHVRRTVIGELHPPDITEAFHRRRVNVDRVISALRLILNAPISVILEEEDTEGMMAFGGNGRSWGSLPPRHSPPVTLDSETAAQVIHVWQFLQKSPNINTLRLPLSRWESSLTRPTLEDRLIDAWISFVQEGELSFRASVRLAEFLGTSGADRKDIYDATRISYTWRSLIVHGSTNKKFTTKNPLQETVQRTLDMLRSALLKVLDLPGRFNPDNLESGLLRRE